MSAIHWFEIAVSDIHRAKKFYETVMGIEMNYFDMREQMGSQVAGFPARNGIGGHLVENAQHGYKPSQDGALIYLVVDGELNTVLGRVEAAGGKVALPKTPLGDAQAGGFVGWVIDSEGNKVAFFSKD
jgi:predicted enzyme related to lactoylglutathione lyase